MTQPNIVNREDWLAARTELLEQEKAFMRHRDSLSALRRELPWVRVDKTYTFDNPSGQQSLAELFGDKSQLIVQHFMLGDDWEEGCPSCSFWADGFDGTTIHLENRDAAFVAVSNATMPRITAYKQRMGWGFNWVSCFGTDFNFDYQASFSKEQIENKTIEYNYRNSDFPSSEAPAISIFAKDDKGDVYHTYSCYSRGLDNMNVAYQYLDLLPKGRDEAGLSHAMAWVKRHDQY